WYTITLDATDTDTVGRLQLHCKMSGALMVYAEFQVLEENVYDAMFAASAALGTDVASILEDTGTTIPGTITTVDTVVDGIKVVTDALTSAGATKLAASAAGIVTGTAVTGTLSTTAMTTSLTETTDDHYNGRVVIFTSGNLAGQGTTITDYTGST